MKKYQQLMKIFERISQLQYAQRILMWDEAVMMPEGAQAVRANTIATLNRTTQKILINKKVKLLIEQATAEDNLSDWDRVNLQLINKKYTRAASVPLKLIEESTKAAIICEQAWRRFRVQNDWHGFFPYFEKSFKYVKEIADRESQALNLKPYDCLIDTYAAGFNQENIDSLFATLKNVLPSLVHEINTYQQNITIPTAVGPFAIEKQKILGLNVMKALHFDFNHGRLDISHHPFCSGNSMDVRVTTRYSETEFLTSLLAICHETGHALYEQGLPKEWIDQPIGQIDNMAMHESQSLLIEMEVCRSLAYFQFLTPLVQNQFNNQTSFTPENLFKQATRVHPGLIRVDADEVTYPLHVIIRYELEKGLICGDIPLADLPDGWNELMIKYLGLSTKDNYKNGVMQDVHWPSGAFGYFPAYTLGRLIAAQLFTTFASTYPLYQEDIRQGQFQGLNAWLQENVYRYASSLSVNGLLSKVTGQSLTPNYFLQHIKRRYLNL